jgi:hypothetical protein
LKFQIVDAMSAVLSVSVYEDNTLMNNIVQDTTNSSIWWYTPTVGAEKVTIKAIDKLGNVSDSSFVLKADCAEPTVKFADQYVCKTPTIKFWVTDPNGVDWSKVNVLVTGCSEECYFYASDLTTNIDKTTGLVTIDDCHLNCTDNQTVTAYVYSGTLSPVNYNPGSSVPGPCDLDGNCGTYRKCTFVVDAVAPYISVGSTDDRPILITITDEKSGVDWSSIEFYEDGVLLCDGFDCTDESVVFDTSNGLILYTPTTSGKDVEIKVTDKTGCNVATAYFTTEEDFLAFGKQYNTPNPFDPRNELTYICPDLSKGAYVTIKIYDFAGDYVVSLCKEKWFNVDECISWDGRTEGGAEVGNGTYLCYIHARDAKGDPKTAVVKITVLKKDQ